MRKSLLTVALACAFPVAAHAQSSITLYGIVDVGIENLDVGSIDATRLQSGISAGSRWGIRGSEELRPGWRALFTLESRIEADTGSTSNNGALYWCRANDAPATAPTVCPGVAFVTTPPAVQVPAALQPTVVGGLNAVNNFLLQSITGVNSVGALFDRQAWGGLVTPVGGFFLGRQYTPAYEVLNKFNVMGDQTALHFGQGFNTLKIRANNSVQYRIELRGFTASAMYGFGGSEGQRNERATSPQSGDDFYGGNLQYNAERWGVGIGYNHDNVVPFNTGASPQKRTGLKLLNAGGYVGFGPVRLYAQYLQRENENPILQPADIQNVVISAGGEAWRRSPDSWVVCSSTPTTSTRCAVWLDPPTRRRITSERRGASATARCMASITTARTMAVRPGQRKMPRPVITVSRTSMTFHAVRNCMQPPLSWTTVISRA